MLENLAERAAALIISVMLSVVAGVWAAGQAMGAMTTQLRAMQDTITQMQADIREQRSDIKDLIKHIK
jgi:hypothetical protein